MIRIQPQTASHDGSSQQIIKDHNATLLFNLVRKHAPVCRADLARLSGLSPATVTVLIDELLQNQWLREIPLVKPASGRGRRPILLEVNAPRGYVATIEIISHGYFLNLYDICLHKVAFSRSRDIASSAQQVLDSLLELLRSSQIDRSRLLGVHVLYPGLFDAQTGRLGFSAVIEPQQMVQRELIAFLREQLAPAHVMINNNAAAVAYSAYIAEPGAPAAPVLAITIEEGMNAGIVMDERYCIPIEAGHIIIQPHGPACNCGNHGCLETLCSAPALFAALNARAGMHLTYQGNYAADCNQLAMQQAAAAFRRKEPAVMDVMREYAYHLCCGLVSIINLFAVRSVRIGGMVRLLGDGFLELLQKTLEQQFHIVTDAGSVSLSLFENDFESSRKAAVVMTLGAIFQRA
ncbi:MAG: ROK family protein [Oscillospiraceae bacterium]